MVDISWNVSCVTVRSGSVFWPGVARYQNVTLNFFVFISFVLVHL